MTPKHRLVARVKGPAVYGLALLVIGLLSGLALLGVGGQVSQILSVTSGTV